MKRIVLCADGTWNNRDQVDKDNRKRRPTNVTKVARAILSRASGGVDQVVSYHDGLGTSGASIGSPEALSAGVSRTTSGHFTGSSSITTRTGTSSSSSGSAAARSQYGRLRAL
jgi:hypothetical protein